MHRPDAWQQQSSDFGVTDHIGDCFDVLKIRVPGKAVGKARALQTITMSDFYRVHPSPIQCSCDILCIL
ncbi:hypothetical protein D3C85_1918650 [compost metagenome]